jgi:hypothetical protein
VTADDPLVALLEAFIRAEPAFTTSAVEQEA